MSWRRLLDATIGRLEDAGVDDAAVSARRIVEHASGFEGADLHVGLEQPATRRGVAALDAMVERRVGGEPLQYVLGRWAFRELDLMVDRRALIPRPETEVVVERALEALRRSVRSGDEAGRADGRRPIVVDLGTGTGAIGLAIAAESPTSEVWLTDVSREALQVAKANLAGSGRAAVRVRLAEGDWFQALPPELAGRIDLVVSNPPYVREDEALPPVVADWEPPGALVAGPTGLEAHEALIAPALEWLASGGALVVECAPDQVETLVEQATAAGFGVVEPFDDLTGRGRGVVARR